MARGKSEYLNEIFRLLSEQRGLLKHLPYSSKQVRKEKRILVCIHRLVDQIICSDLGRAPATERTRRSHAWHSLLATCEDQNALRR
jgi:hypothetical protein